MMTKKTTSKRNKHSAVIPIKTLILGFIALGLIYFLFLSGSHNVVRYFRQKAQKENLIREIDSLKVQKAKLKSESERLKNDPDYIEKIAREKYNMKKKDEKVYKIIKEK